MDDFLLRKSQLGRARAVHVQLQRGIVEILRDENVGDAADAPDLVRQLHGCVVALSILSPATCTSMGAGSPMFRTASTNPPDWKYALSSGSSAAIALLTAAMYS